MSAHLKEEATALGKTLSGFLESCSALPLPRDIAEATSGLANSGFSTGLVLRESGTYPRETVQIVLGESVNFVLPKSMPGLWEI
jgi:hypothetical protein